MIVIPTAGGQRPPLQEINPARAAWTTHTDVHPAGHRIAIIPCVAHNHIGSGFGPFRSKCLALGICASSSPE